MMTLNPGDLIASRYVIDRVVGSGGMGIVYRARDQLSGELVALKFLHTSGGANEDGERFTREALILSELHHPGIVAHVAHGQTPQGLRFLAMQWLEGEDLAQRLGRGTLPLADALLLIQQVAQALAFAQERGILHRDLKPTNIFLPGGEITRVKILDFGIARRLAPASAMTRAGAIVGTPEYMAPEQARGERDLTPAADVFSLGCVLYECLIGEPPFVAEHVAAVLVRILFEEPTPVEQRRPGLPKPVGELVARMLAKEPSQRIGSASAVAAALAAIEQVQDLPLLATLAAPAKITPVQSDSEQSLLSLVLALSPEDAAVGSPGLSASQELSHRERQGRLLTELRSMGAQADLLLVGALVVTVPQMISAQDQATQAARCALMIKKRWPEAQVMVVTGCGTRSRGGLTGEVLDRAWRLFRNHETPAASSRSVPPSASSYAGSPQIRIDHVSAGLLEGRFDVVPLASTDGGFTIGSERPEPDAGRLLLGKPTPCLGRERELSTLEALYSECQDELVARAVLVLGPPGLGKSRLRHEFVRRLESRGGNRVILTARGDPMKVKSTYGFLGEALRKFLNLRDGQALGEQRERIRQRIFTTLPASDALRITVFIGEVCGVPFPDEESPLLRAARQDPRIMSDQVERAWLDGLQLLRTDEPLLLILEDLHWSDALTVRLVEAALRRLRDHAFMVLALARPEVSALYPNLWAGVVQPLPLHPLPRKASERLVRQILGPEVSPTRLAQLVEQSAGNPLFLEELIRAAVERKVGTLPETVTAMIQARIGRLAAGARRFLRAASVFGEMFWENGVFGLLLATHGDEPMHSILVDLVREEIIEQVADGRFVGEYQYQFRHALVRDAVYGLVNEEEKVAWHAAAGHFLEAAGEREAFLLADHYQLGSELAKAARCYARAAEQAYDAGSMDTALEFTKRGLTCEATGAVRGDLLSFQCLINLWREQYDQVLTAGHEALSLMRPGATPSCRVLYTLTLATLFLEPGRLPELMQQLLTVAPEPDALSTYFHAIGLLGAVFVGIGRHDICGALVERAQQLSKQLPEHDHNAWSHYFFMEGIYRDLGIKHPHTCIAPLLSAARTAREAGNRQMQPIIVSHLTKALADLGQRADLLSMLRSTVLVAEQANDPFPLAYARAFLARRLAATENPADWEEASQLARLIVPTKNPATLGWAHQVLGQVALARGELTTAEVEAQTACQFHATLPPYRAESAVLWSRTLRAQGKDRQGLTVCQATVQELNTLGIEPHELLALYVEIAETSERLALPESARQAVALALPILGRRTRDIPDSAMRATYLRELPENVRLLELGRQWAISTDLLQ